MALPSSNNNLQLMSYLKMIFRRKEILIVCSLIGLTVGICAGILMPKQYQSSTVILVKEGKSDNPLFEQLAVSTTVRERLTTIQESMLGWSSLVKLVERLGLDKNIKTKQQFENLIQGIRRRIDIRMRGHNVLYLSYTGDDPVETQSVVKNITDIFIERNVNIQNQETTDAIAFIEEQLKVYKGKIKSAEIAKLQDRLDELLVDSTEKHPLVKQLREQIDRKKEELRKENLPFTHAERLKADKDTSLISSIQGALETLEQPTKTPTPDEKSDLYKLMLIDKLGSVVARDSEVNEKIYNQLLNRLETAKITQRLQSSKEGTHYTIVDPPRVPLIPSKPNRLLIAVIGFFAGLAVGAGIIFLMEFLDRSFIDVEDAKDYLGAPLLGAISKLTTAQEIARNRDRKRWLYVLTILGCIVAILGAVTLSTAI
ncbi:MAG: GNVR domain-containing protein [Candidatus Omnitrophota bacterium]